MQVLAEVAVVKAEVVMVKTKEAVVKADVGPDPPICQGMAIKELEIGDNGIEDW